MRKFPTIWTNPIHFMACGFGVGALPVMPGTYGTALGVVFYLLLSRLPLLYYILVSIGLFLIGVYLCGKTNRDFGTQDHPAAVWDEVVGFLFVMIAVPKTWYFIVLGFALFRLFDIWKPFPIRWVDRHLHGGFGVMFDDVLAAFFAWIVLQAILVFIK